MKLGVALRETRRTSFAELIERLKERSVADAVRGGVQRPRSRDSQPRARGTEE